jgi:hypothetical protein
MLDYDVLTNVAFVLFLGCIALSFGVYHLQTKVAALRSALREQHEVSQILKEGMEGSIDRLGGEVANYQKFHDAINESREALQQANDIILQLTKKINKLNKLDIHKERALVTLMIMVEDKELREAFYKRIMSAVGPAFVVQLRRLVDHFDQPNNTQSMNLPAITGEEHVD